MPPADRARIESVDRLEVLRSTGLLDSGAEACFDRFTALAGRLIGAPVALLSLVDADRQFLKSRHGSELTETPLSHSFCQHVVAGDRPLVAPDARDHPLLHDNDAITDLGVIAYAGVPVRAGGQTLGAFCVVDGRPAAFTDEHVAILEDLAAACMAEIELRLALKESERANARLHEQARRDALTGLPNRRALVEDLGRAVHAARPAALGLLDLNGFKAFNDRFGHPAGDDLLRRLGARLSEAVDARAYRMGGDEFCVLMAGARGAEQAVLDAARAALSERGPDWAISASAGLVLLPEEADGVTALLRIADSRMYAEKRGHRGSARRQAKEVLLRAIGERDVALDSHGMDVGILATAVAHRLGLSAAEIEDVRDAAELHDVGKLAVPDVILNKPVALDGDELEFIRRHTEIGQRILAGAPALASVADIVRATHERYDGCGYPDGVAGEAIPIGARIVFACDAFDAMTTDRPYRPAMPVADALAELERCAGSQFDPAVVVAVRDAVRAVTPVA